MNGIEEYSFVMLPIYRYVTIPCDEKYQNKNFDELLLLIGRYYFKNPSLGINRVCALIKDEINAEWHLNRLRKSIQRKKITTMQVKSVRRSFSRIHDAGQQFIRIPFNIVPIFFYILSLLSQISEENLAAYEFASRMNTCIIGDYLYNYHTKEFVKKYPIYSKRISDKSLVGKYLKLNSNLTGPQSFMQHYFKDIQWNKLDSYIIK